jgi:hypothetical protein
MKVISKPHLFAVHIEQKMPEFRPAAKLWASKDCFASRTCIVHNDCPNPFKGEGPRMFQLVTEPDYSSADYLEKNQVCFQVGDAVFEIPSPNGRITHASFPPVVTEANFVNQVCFQVGDGVFELPSPNGRITHSSFPPVVTEANFVLMGGLLDNRGCLPKAFDSILAKSLSLGGRLTIRVPLDCVYSSPDIDKLKPVSVENAFRRSLSSKFGTEWMVAIDGTLIAGRENAPASLQWFSTARKMCRAAARE